MGPHAGETIGLKVQRFLRFKGLIDFNMGENHRFAGSKVQRLRVLKVEWFQW